MKDDYIINIEGEMEQENECDSVSLMTRGRFVKRNGRFFITYMETEATGYEGNRTTVKVDAENKVTMLRHGPAPSRLVIECGRRHVCHYDTQWGSLSLGVAADEIQNNLTENGGELVFSYMLDTGETQLSRNKVKITVTEVE